MISAEAMDRRWGQEDLQALNADREAKYSGIGCVVIIVDKTGLVYTVDEVTKGTGWGPVAEKRREGETAYENVIAVICEEVGVTRADLGDFWYVPDLSLVGQADFVESGRNFLADVVLVYYSGRQLDFLPRNEVGPVGFSNPRKLLQLTRLREATRPALLLVMQGHRLEDFLTVAQNGRAMPLFAPLGSDFDPAAYVEQRAALPDLIIES